MPSLILSTPGTSASLIGERIRVEPGRSNGDDPQPARDIHLFDIEQVVVSASAQISMAAIAELLRREIPVIITSWNDDVIGICQPPAPNNVARLAQYKRTDDRQFALALAINWVEAKILNSRRVLQRLASNRDDVDVTPQILALGELAQHCRRATSADTLRGYEGTAAGRYFETYGSFYPETAPFERRSRRPPHNAPNAILSYAYTLLAAEAECIIHTCGLDATVGFFHEPADRRPSLALDIMEPFRAPLADAMALDLISHGTLHPQHHFEPRNGGIYLNSEGKKRFFVAYEKRMEREFTSEQTQKRTTIRGELKNQVIAVKKAVLDGEPFEPFIMN